MYVAGLLLIILSLLLLLKAAVIYFILSQTLCQTNIFCLLVC